jgi:hypothetical protein
MKKWRPFKYFKTNPEIVRLALVQQILDVAQRQRKSLYLVL